MQTGISRFVIFTLAMNREELVRGLAYILAGRQCLATQKSLPWWTFIVRKG